MDIAARSRKRPYTFIDLESYEHEVTLREAGRANRPAEPDVPVAAARPLPAAAGGGNPGTSLAANSGTLAANPEALAANPGALAANPGPLTANPGTLTANPGTLAANPGALSANPGGLAANLGILAANPGRRVRPPFLPKDSCSLGTRQSWIDETLDLREGVLQSLAVLCLMPPALLSVLVLKKPRLKGQG